MIKSTLKKMLLGDTVVTEYSKITIPGDDIQEKVYLAFDGHVADVSQSHWILCIEPLVFGVWIGCDTLASPFAEKEGYRLYFNDGVCSTAAAGGSQLKRNAVAIVSLKCIVHIEEESGTLLLLKMQKSSLHHFNFIVTKLLFSRYYKKEGMPFTRFSSFVSAYSYPRRIRLVSFRQGSYFNLFPMDLLGGTPEGNRYVFGLRHTNTTLARILETGKLAVAEVPFEQKEAVYQLAKHHSSQPPALDELPFGVVESKHFGFYIPEWATSYQEIRIMKTLNLGSHMLMWGTPVSETVLNPPARHLYLLHFLEYFRRKGNGLPYPLV